MHIEANTEGKKMQQIEHDGDTWKIVGVGTVRDGKTLVHLASTTRGRHQKNGFYPVQMMDWIDSSLLK
jgi:hypothetical protein